MSYFNEILLKLGLCEDAVGGIKCTVVDFRGVLIEGHKGIFSYSTDRIEINEKRGKITVAGSDLHIKEIGDSEIFISGRITELKKE